jgi:hypothetical protein
MGIRADPITRVTRVVGIVITPPVFISFKRPERPGSALDLPGLSHHQAVPLGADVLEVARATRDFVHPWTPRIRIEMASTVGLLFSRGRRVPAVTNNTTGRITAFAPDGDNLPHHPACGVSNRLYALMTGGASGFVSIRIGHLGSGVRNK